MPPQFSPPANLDELNSDGRATWHELVRGAVTGSLRGSFFDPLGVTLAPDAERPTVTWGAFPKRLNNEPAPAKWLKAEVRTEQEEYCEWVRVQDEQGRLVRAIFTTEVGLYYAVIAATDPDLLVSIYQEHVSPDVRLRHLVDANRRYLPKNRWNRSGAMHMIQINNTLGAAITLVADASIRRVDRDDQPVANPDDLIACGVNGDPDRNSDPTIAGAVNELARRGARISLAEPMGLYLDELDTEGWDAGGVDLETLWTVTRGTPGFAVRGVLALPSGDPLSAIKIDGQPISSPSQIAKHLKVRVTAVADGFAQHAAPPVRCAIGAAVLGGPAEGDAGIALPAIDPVALAAELAEGVSRR